MSQKDAKACAARLRLALDLADSGILMRQAQLRRQFPNDTDEMLSERLRQWLQKTPMQPPEGFVVRSIDSFLADDQ